jgi:6-phosphofructokinase 1
MGHRAGWLALGAGIAGGADLILSEVSGVMVAARGEAMPLEDVAGRKKLVPPDHPWIESARRVGTILGDLK